MHSTLKNDTFSAILLISGCCIGAGMLGLPIVSYMAGFMPSSLAMIFCYTFTTFTGLLLLEATLWFDKKVNLLSIAEFALGKIGKIFTWGLFLFLFYCLFVAYYEGGGQVYQSIFLFLFHQPLSREISIILFTLSVTLISYAGTSVLASLNRGLILGLLFTYLILILLGITHVSMENLEKANWTASFATIPILFICFGYQNLVPSLTYYLKKNTRMIQYAICIGNLIPFFIYFFWNFIILGMLSSSLNVNNQGADTVSNMLMTSTENHSVVLYVKIFSFFALLTSCLPNGITFIDFLQDGLRSFKKVIFAEKILLCALVFFPPMLFCIFNANLFLKALNFAGGFIDVLLFGLLPALIVLLGRYVKKVNSTYQVIGGLFTPVLVFILSLGILLIKFFI